ncbi:MAG: serine/threonine-protein kinase [Acidobacteriota bacterium]
MSSMDGVDYGPYRTEAEIGRGGMGVVYRARHVTTGERVALKTVIGAQSSLAASIRREIAALARLSHPGVVRIVDHGVERGTPWYAMELLAGPSLRSQLHAANALAATTPMGAGTASVERSTSATALEIGRALSIARRLCAPLSFLHGEGVVHADLKPENVILGDGEAPILMDFGLATTFAASLSRESLTDAGAVAGTVWYIAPEQLRGEALDARADLYALGCLLYELLTGEPPFVDAAAGEIVRMHLCVAPDPPSLRRGGSPEGSTTWCSRLLSKQPRTGLDTPTPWLPISPPSGRRTGCAHRVATLPLSGADDRTRGGSSLPPRRGRAALRGRGAFVLVEGERRQQDQVAMDAASEAAGQGCQVLTGACADVPEGERAPLAPLGKSLVVIADICREGGPATMAALLGPGARVTRSLRAGACGPRPRCSRPDRASHP